MWIQKKKIIFLLPNKITQIGSLPFAHLEINQSALRENPVDLLILEINKI